MRNMGRKSIVILLMLTIIITGCNKKEMKNSDSAESVATTGVETNENQPTVEGPGTSDNADFAAEVKQLGSAEEIFVTTEAHNIYTGTLGEQTITFDFYIMKDEKTAQIAFYSESYPEDIIYDAQIDENNVISCQKDGVQMAFLLQEDGSANGCFSADGTTKQQVQLHLSHVNASGDVKSRYSYGTNQEVEDFVAQIRETVANKDMKAFAELVSYPIDLQIEEGATIQDAQGFVGLGAPTIFRDEFVNIILGADPRFMFSNDQGTMYGNGEFNVWIAPVGEGSMRIIAINN